MIGRRVALCLLLAVQMTIGSAARADTDTALTIWRLLDYVAVDYREAVRDGAVINQDEFAEMVEFSATTIEKLKSLPAAAEKASLLGKAGDLQAAIDRKEGHEQVATMARSLAAALIAAYPVPLAPNAVPDLKRARALYAESCASCHGASGDGKGPAAEGLNPAPIDFTDKDRADERSIFALYQVISQGIDGTSMTGFGDLASQDRWGLAFYVGALAYPAQEVGEGERLWKANAELRQTMTLTSLVNERPATLKAMLGASAEPIIAYLRRHPEASVSSSGSWLVLVRTRLSDAVKAYEAGNQNVARNLALSAYLDGFEPVEKVLAVHDAVLMRRIEAAMGGLRSAMQQGAPVESVRAQVEALDELFVNAERALAPGQASSLSSFLGAFVVLLREALEALLVVVVMLSLLRKTQRHDAEPYVHLGWISALAVGALTWAVATYIIAISGAQRELTEGLGSLFAAAVLIWVGVWMHSKSHAEAWRRYIQDKVGRAVSKRSGWALFVLTFVVVYREVLETILFYAALWNDDNAIAIVAGAGVAILMLVLIAFVLKRYSQTLPIGQFFAYSSYLIALLCVVMIGKGMWALQEADWVPITLLDGVPRLEVFGLYPTAEGLVVQTAAAMVLALGFWNSRRTSAAPSDDIQ